MAPQSHSIPEPDPVKRSLGSLRADGQIIGEILRHDFENEWEMESPEALAETWQTALEEGIDQANRGELQDGEQALEDLREELGLD